MNSSELDFLRTEAAAILKAQPGQQVSLTPLAGGGNNRVYRVELEGRVFLLKRYFRHPEDRRDRLHHEWSWLSFAAQHRLDCVPQPVAADRERGLALYSFVPGRRPQPEEVGLDLLNQAIALHLGMNAHRDEPAAERIPIASEAAFSFEEHMRMCEVRMVRLNAIPAVTETDQACSDFLRKTLLPLWARVKDHLPGEVARCRFSMQEPLARKDCCLSPSDFGFHNSLLDDQGHVVFVDFEYAGWDDPAKLVCEFFYHPAFPLPLDHHRHFQKETLQIFDDPSMHAARCSLLQPVYQLKWCTIILNPFLPRKSEPRRFARPQEKVESAKRRRLDRARALARTCEEGLQTVPPGLDHRKDQNHWR